MKVKSSTFVFLIKTKCNRGKVEKVSNWLGYKHNFVVDNKGWSGGLTFLWKNKMRVELDSFTQRYKSLMVAYHDNN